MTEKKQQEKKLEHTKGGSTTKDATDLGVMGTPSEAEGPQGPEDALDPDASNRGDYAGKLGDSGQSYEMRVVGHREDGSPIIERVRQK